MTEEQKTPATPAEVEAAMESIARKAYDAGRQHGFEAASEEQDLRHWTGGQVTAGGNAERAEAAYEAELRPLIFRLQGEGVRGKRMLDSHPDVVALKARNGR